MCLFRVDGRYLSRDSLSAWDTDTLFPNTPSTWCHCNLNLPWGLLNSPLGVRVPGRLQGSLPAFYKGLENLVLRAKDHSARGKKKNCNPTFGTRAQNLRKHSSDPKRESLLKLFPRCLFRPTLFSSLLIPSCSTVCTQRHI